jgi:hypothetical protein
MLEEGRYIQREVYVGCRDRFLIFSGWEDGAGFTLSSGFSFLRIENGIWFYPFVTSRQASNSSSAVWESSDVKGDIQTYLDSLGAKFRSQLSGHTHRLHVKFALLFFRVVTGDHPVSISPTTSPPPSIHAIHSHPPIRSQKHAMQFGSGKRGNQIDV